MPEALSPYGRYHATRFNMKLILTACLVGLLFVMYRRSPQPESGGETQGIDKGYPRDSKGWYDFQKTLAAEVKEADTGSKGYDVIFYGDSITETWRGTQIGNPCTRCTGGPQIFSDMFASKYNAVALAIAGDFTSHLLWRLQHGEMPQKHHPKAVVILIGTNDLAFAASKVSAEEKAEEIAAEAPETAKRVLQLIHLIEQKMPHTQIVLIALLPRSNPDIKRNSPTFKQPSIYTPAIEEVNMHFQEYAKMDGRIHYVDCGQEFLDKGGNLDGKLMPDGLHPYEAGMQAYAWCVQPVLDSIVVRAL